MTYQSGEELYLIKGYGQQMTGGYSIQVAELSLSDTAVFLKQSCWDLPVIIRAGSHPIRIS